MKSTIKISVGENNQPQITFRVSKDNSDLRDTICKSFIEKLNGSSSCNIQCIGGFESDTESYNEWVITPIPNK